MYISVSYTHLDVYKRQLLNSVLVTSHFAVLTCIDSLPVSAEYISIRCIICLMLYLVCIISIICLKVNIQHVIDVHIQPLCFVSNVC